MVPGIQRCSITICGMIRGYHWMAEGSREAKISFAALPLNTVELKDLQNEGLEMSVLTQMVCVWKM